MEVIYHMSTRADVLEKVLEGSPYFQFLYKNASEIGFEFENGCELVLLTGRINEEENHLAAALGLSKYNHGIVDIQTFESSEKVEAEIWVRLDEQELISLSINGQSVTKLSFASSNKGEVLHPSVEKILQRIFMPLSPNKYPLEDRVELVYGGLFGFIEPSVIWGNKQSDLFVFKYPRAYKGLDAFITSGFSNPNLPSSQIKSTDLKISGYGYELIIFAKPDEEVLKKELISWAQYVDNGNGHIYPGQYLEYKEGNIPQTDISGFIIVPPIDFPEFIPVSDGYARLNVLIGVTSKELAIVKQEDVYTIADEFFNQDYINYTPSKRESVI